MDRKRIMDILLSQKEYTEEQKQIIKGIEEAKCEWEIAKEYFQLVSDPRLVDYAIYREDEAKAKYIYFLLQARSKHITVDASFMFEELTAVNK